MFGKLQKYLKEIYVIRTIERSGLFDKKYYLKNNLDVARSCMSPIKHYVRHGWKEGRNPSRFFDTKQYMSTHQDFINIAENPFFNYCIEHGGKKSLSNNKSIQKIRGKKNKNEELEFTIKDNLQNNHNPVFRDNERDVSIGLISIIIPVYNSERYLSQLLDSVIRQTYNNIEIIIVDDGSGMSNEITKIVNRYKQKLVLSFYRLEQNRGANYARNYGFSKSSGEYLFFCDSDIVLADDIFEKMVQTIHETSSVSWIYCNYMLGDRELRFFPFEGNRLYRYNFCSTMSLIRYSAFPGFDNSIKRYQDWDLFLTIYENGGTGKWINEFLFYAEDREDGITKSDKVKDHEARVILKKKHKRVCLL